MLKENGCVIPIKEVRLIEPPGKPKKELYKRGIKISASMLYGLTVAGKKFQKTSNWSMTEKDLKNLDRSADERKSETKEIEELYSFKTMVRMLYQAGIVISKEVSNAASIPY
jgi:seryl-tRNA(Sec) selenium transferase